MNGQVVISYITIAAAAGLCSAGIGVYAFRRRGVAAALPLSITALGNTVWALSAVGMRLPVDSLAVRTAHFFQYVGITLTVAGVLTFALAYTGRTAYLTRRVGALLAIEPVMVYLAVGTSSYHNLFFQSVTVVDGIEAVATTPGPLFVLHLTYSYALIVISLGMLFQQVIQSRSVYRGQTLAVLVGVCLPLVGNAAYVGGLSPVDLAPVAFAGTGVMLTLAIYRYQFVEVLPIARDTVVENLEDPVVVLDVHDRVVDVNPAARRAFGIDEQQTVLGAPSAALLPAPIRAVFRDQLSSSDAAAVSASREKRPTVETDGRSWAADGAVIDLETPTGTRHYDSQLTQLTGDRGQVIGWLLLLRDVTRQHRQQAALQQRNEQLDQFASVVSHDLRNPLAVAQGYTEMLDDEHAEEIATSLDRMEAIIDDVLTLARQGQTAENLQTVDLATIARTAWESVDTDRGSLVVSGTLEFLADESRLRRLFENLFRNAVEHAADGDDLTVWVGTLDGDTLGFYVADDGPGIPPSRREAVLETGVSGTTEGTGLGLAIVNGIAQAHGWELSITDGDAGGARFEFRGPAN